MEKSEFSPEGSLNLFSSYYDCESGFNACNGKAAYEKDVDDLASHIKTLQQCVADLQRCNKKSAPQFGMIFRIHFSDLKSDPKEFAQVIKKSQRLWSSIIRKEHQLSALDSRFVPDVRLPLISERGISAMQDVLKASKDFDCDHLIPKSISFRYSGN
ncbi:MAG: hypothetical protein H7A38_04550 [Chlamydiales bacterium]|nr:hypothetical protein [Chlamydiales bacterium]